MQGFARGKYMLSYSSGVFLLGLIVVVFIH